MQKLKKFKEEIIKTDDIKLKTKDVDRPQINDVLNLIDNSLSKAKKIKKYVKRNYNSKRIIRDDDCKC